MTWIRENQFWAGSIGAASLIALVFLYLYFTSDVSSLQGNVQSKLKKLKEKVQQTQSGKDEVIPSREVEDVIKRSQERYAEELKKLALYYLKSTRDLERMFEGERDPSQGLFKSRYEGAKKDLGRMIRENDVTMSGGNGSVPFGGGADEEGAIRWPSLTSDDETMESIQKRFWVVKRVVKDAIRADVEAIEKISVRRDTKPIEISQIGAPLARQYHVDCSFQLPARRIGPLLSYLMDVSPEDEGALEMKMYIPSYNVSKQQTTSSMLNNTWSHLKTVKGEKWKNWTSGGLGQLPDELSEPHPVKVSMEVYVLDVEEKTVARIMRKAGMGTEAIRKQMKSALPFLDDSEVRELIKKN